MDDNVYPYHVFLTTKTRDRGLRRTAKEKLSYAKECAHVHFAK